YGFIGLGLAGGLILVALHSSETTPRNYISRGSYDHTHQTLAIYGQDRQDAPLTPTAQILINGAEAGFDSLDGKYELKDFHLAADPRIDHLELAEYPRFLDAASTRSWMLGAAILECSIILLVVTNAAASAVTREKEDGTLDLLLSTPITSRYYIWGKL